IQGTRKISPVPRKRKIKKHQTRLTCPSLGHRIVSTSRAGNPVPAQPPPREGNPDNGNESQNPQNRRPAPRTGRSPTDPDHRTGRSATRLRHVGTVLKLCSELPQLQP